MYSRSEKGLDRDLVEDQAKGWGELGLKTFNDEDKCIKYFFY